MNIRSKSTVYTLSYTATDDEAHRAENNPEIILSEANIHCYSNDCYYGNSARTLGIIRTNGYVFWTSSFRPYDFIFKNYTAGSNTNIEIVGIIKEG